MSFLFWDYFPPEDENNIISEIYNLEAYEYLSIKSLSKQNLFTIEELNLIYYNIGQELEKWYDDLGEDFYPELVKIPKDNMLKRASWIEVPCLYYWEHTKEFISFWFDIIETYLKSNNHEDIEKSLFIINFLTKYWFKNLDLGKMSYLLSLLINLVNSFENLPDSYMWNLYTIISANLTSWEAIPNSSFILMWNISLSLWLYDWAYQAFVGAHNSWFKIRQNIKELLEDMLLNKEFTKANELELRFWKYSPWNNVSEVKKEEMDPEMLISFLLEKINKWRELKVQDYQIIEKLTLI